MTALVDIYNRACSAIGTKESIADPAEVSKEAETCNLWYPIVRDKVLASAFWPSTRASFRLNLAAERDVDLDWTSSDPDPGFQYLYNVPSGMLRPRFMTNYSRFMLTNFGGSAAIASNNQNSILIYTKRQEDPDLWDVELQMAIIYALAAHICIKLTGKRDRMLDAVTLANQFITEARVASANTDQVPHDTVPEWLNARGYSGNAPATRYLYPYGPMISLTEGVPIT